MASTMYAVLDQAAENYGNAPALHQPTGQGKYQTYYMDRIPERCPRRSRADCGGSASGRVRWWPSTRRLALNFIWPISASWRTGPSLPRCTRRIRLKEQIANLRASDARAVFVEDAKSMEALIEAAGHPALPVKWIVLTGQAEPALTLEALRVEGRKALADDPKAFEKIHVEVRPEDHAILYLTSGATGEPKMGLTTHAALVANVEMGPIALGLSPQDSTISFLPSAHIAQRVVIELLPIGMGVPVWFSESLAKLPSELKAIRPTFLLAPPRVWERIFASIHTEVKKKSTSRAEAVSWRSWIRLRSRASAGRGQACSEVDAKYTQNGRAVGVFQNSRAVGRPNCVSRPRAPRRSARI